jgi:hypothetical protein
MRTFRNALAQRIAFWGRAMSAGARWMWDVLDKSARIGAVLAFLAVSIGGVLLHQPAAVIGAVVGLLVLFAFAEGTYRVARDAEQQRVAAEQQQVDTQPDANALWLSGQLSVGNDLLARWRLDTPSYNARDEIDEAAVWENKTRGGLAAKLPVYSGHFGLDVGLGQEFIFSPIEAGERTRLRRRLHRLGEIADRYSMEQSK